MYQESPEIQREYLKRKYLEYQENKKCDKLEYFPLQIKQIPCYICTICHRRLYQRSVRILKHENITYSLQNCIIQRNVSLKNFIHVKRVEGSLQ